MAFLIPGSPIPAERPPARGFEPRAFDNEAKAEPFDDVFDQRAPEDARESPTARGAGRADAQRRRAREAGESDFAPEDSREAARPGAAPFQIEAIPPAGLVDLAEQRPLSVNGGDRGDAPTFSLRQIGLAAAASLVGDPASDDSVGRAPRVGAVGGAPTETAPNLRTVKLADDGLAAAIELFANETDAAAQAALIAGQQAAELASLAADGAAPIISPTIDPINAGQATTLQAALIAAAPGFAALQSAQGLSAPASPNQATAQTGDDAALVEASTSPPVYSDEAPASARDASFAAVTSEPAPLRPEIEGFDQSSFDPQNLIADRAPVELGLDRSSTDAARTVSAPDAARLAVSASPPAAQIAAAFSAAAGSDSIELRLDPPDLGSVRIQLSFERGDGVTAVVSTERGETLDLLRRSQDELARELERAGFARVRLDFSAENSGRGAFADRGGFAGGGGDFALEAPDDARFFYVSPRADNRLDRLV